MHSEPLTSRGTVRRPDILTYQFQINSRCIRLLTRNIYIIFHRFGGVLFCLAFVTGTVSLVQGINSTCESVSVMEGSTTSLTCTFGDDLRKFNKSVYLDHRQENNSNHALVASCRRISNGFDCKTLPGYLLTGNVTNTLTVNITNVNKTSAGKYWCEIFGADHRDRRTCEVCLLVNSNNTTDPILPNIEKDERESNKRALAIAFGIFIPVILCAVIILILIVLRSKRLVCFRNSSGGSHLNPMYTDGTDHDDDTDRENELL